MSDIAGIFNRDCDLGPNAAGWARRRARTACLNQTGRAIRRSAAVFSLLPPLPFLDFAADLLDFWSSGARR